MRASERLAAPFRQGLPTLLFILLALFLWIAGGASKGDAIGQSIVRATSWGCLIVALLLGDGMPFRRGRAVLWFLAAALVLAALQLVPLPPDVWAALPGRALFAEANALAGGVAPWRPMAIVPSAALNALSSLVVPFAVLYLITMQPQVSDATMVRVLLVMIVAGAAVGLLQFVGVSLDTRFVNTGLEASGTFANRNHFALMTAFGFVVLPVWAFLDDRRPGWRGPVTIALGTLMALAILASGSRAGTALGAVSLACGLLLAQRPLRRMLARYPRWVGPVLLVGIVVVLGGLILLSVAADRAVSIDRALQVDTGQDMRSRALPTVLAMIANFLPWGSGLGGFDTLFRMNEPATLLKPTYFNRAHNDILEVVLDAGIPGALLLAAAILWWAWRSLRVWRRGNGGAQAMLPRLGSVLLLLVLLASAVDYPARTPMVMAVIVIAATWLAGPQSRGRAALPRADRHL